MSIILYYNLKVFAQVLVGDFSRHSLRNKNLNLQQVRSVQNMIRKVGIAPSLQHACSLYSFQPNLGEILAQIDNTVG